MNFFDKLFGKKSRFGGDGSSEVEERGKYMPVPEVPTDDKFLINFQENGGKFLYCSNQDEVYDLFREILKENDWVGEVCCLDDNLGKLFEGFGLDFTKNTKAPFCLLACEYLIANTGAILLSSNQIGEKKPNELPENLVVFAGTSQLIDSLGDGLQLINARKKNLPTNIRTIKNFKPNADLDEHFMSYGSTAKNLYLLLLEDL